MKNVSGNTRTFLTALEEMNGSDSSAWIELITADEPDLHIGKFCRLFRGETGATMTNDEIKGELEEMGIL